MDDYGYNVVNNRQWPKSSRYFTMPQRCELEVCRLPDWHLQAYKDRFSSSSYADSESEEEMTKRLAGRGIMAPLHSPPKMRRGGTSHSGMMHGHHPYVVDKHHGHMPVSNGQNSKQHLQFSHSSSDDEVFMDPASMRERNIPPPFMHRPPPYPQDMDRFTAHPSTGYHYPDNYSQQHCYEQSRFSNGVPVFRQRQRMRERHHSMPPRGRDSSRSRELSRGREQSRGRDHSRGRELLRDAAAHQDRYAEAALHDRQSALPSSGDSSDEGSLRPRLSADDDFNSGYRYGYPSSLGSSRDSKTSSGSSSSSYQNTPGTRGGMAGRGRGQGPSRGGYHTYRPVGDKWNGMSRSRSGHQDGGMGPSLSHPPGLLPGQRGMKHHPLSARASNFLHVNHGVHGMPHKEPKPLDPSTMSMAEKLHRFMLFVRHENSNRINDIQTIENAITGCHLDLKTFYEAEDVGVYQGRHTFSGKLSLSGVFLARAVGQVKRELKHECYKLALQVLRTKTVTEILKQHDIGIEAIRQKFEECSSADTDASVSEAVVNLASAAPIAVAMETVATTEERWQDFISYLKGLNTEMGNTISRIELAISGSRCGLERVYSDTTIMDQYQGKPGFQGSLCLGGVLQAQGQGSKKKEAKQKTYDLAYQRFTSLEVEHLLKGVAPQNIEEFKKERSVNVVVKEIRTAEHIKKFELFIDRIKDSSVREGPVTLLDLTANQLQLLITCMYKKIEEQDVVSNLCQLFVGDILISEGEGRQKKEAQADAYSKAYEILISTPVETLISESHRLNKEELQGADVQDVVVKGQIKKEESNLPRLRQQFLNVEEALSEKQSVGMVVVEHQDWIHDRKRHAFCILQNSALMNVMLLKWCTEIETGFFTCRVQLQGEEVGTAKAHSRQQARNLASADALFRMYETQPVLRIISVDQSASWVTCEQLMNRMKTMEEDEFREVDEEWHSFLRKQASKSDGDESSADNVDLSEQQKEEGKLERHLRVVATKVAEEFQQRGDILDELVFAPDIPHCVRRHLTTSVAKMGLRCNQCQKDGKIYLAIQFRARVDKVVEEMKARGVTKTNRFELVEDRSMLPCHADIAEEIEIARTLTRQDRIASRTAPKLQSADKESRDAATGNSLNGSLFEETMEGFVTARSYMMGDANTSLQPPKVQSTPHSTPAKASSPAKKQTTPAEEVYTRFARAMMASGIGQTLVPMECSTPVSNILINPPKSDSLSGSGTDGAPVIKNILVSPPQGRGPSVTLSSPMKNLSLSSAGASSSFPQPDFSASVSPAKEVRTSQANQGESSCSTLSPNPSSKRSCFVSGTSSSVPQQGTSCPPGWQPHQKGKRSSPPVIVPSSCVTVGQSSAGVAHRVPSGQDVSKVTEQQLFSGQSLQDKCHGHNGYSHSNPTNFPNTTNYHPTHYTQSSYPQGNFFHYPHSKPDYTDSSGNTGGFYRYPYSGGAWQPQAWPYTDPSAPHAIQMSPASQCEHYGDHTNTQSTSAKPQGLYTAAMYVENELTAHAVHSRRWNHYNPV